MDPCVVVTLGKNIFRTHKVSHTCDPVWNSCGQLFVTADTQHWPIKLSVYDHDKFTANDFVGSVQIPISTIIDSEPDIPFVLKLDLTGDAEKTNVSSIVISARFIPVSEAYEVFWNKILEFFVDAKSDTITADELTNVLVRD